MALTSGTASVTAASATAIAVTCGTASGGTGPYTYQWYKSSDGANTWSLIGGATSVSYNDTSVVQANEYWYELQATDTGVSPNTTTFSNRVMGLAVNAITTPSANQSSNGLVTGFVADSRGDVLTSEVARQGTLTESTPSIASATSTVLLAANSARKYLSIQNNSAANIMVSLSGNTLTGIVPTASNKGIVLQPGSSYENPNHQVSTTAITVYQTSGGSINTVYVAEA